MIRTFSPAKLNLYLHVIGKRADGYHLLDSLVAFCDVGDEVRLEPSPTFSFAIEGPMALSLKEEPQDNNLVVKAARLLSEATGKPLGFKLTLVKNLPIASGIGGGSGNAAAALRIIARHWALSKDDPVLYEIAKKLGQDVPCCLENKTCYFTGIGDVLEPGPQLPHTNIVMVNPNKALSTASVFRARKGDFSSRAELETVPTDVAELASMIKARNNDLTETSLELLPDISKALAALEGTENCLLARMSGSGATCFGIYTDRGSARNAAACMFNNHPGWWVVATNFPYKGEGPGESG